MDGERRTGRRFVVVRVRHARWPYERALVVRMTIDGVPGETWGMFDQHGKLHELRLFRPASDVMLGGDYGRRRQ